MFTDSTGLLIALIGPVGNAIGLIVLASGRNQNFNMKAAFLEVLNGAPGSVTGMDCGRRSTA